MRVARASIVVFLAACGSRVGGTAAAPAGTTVEIWEQGAADAYQEALRKRSDNLKAHIAADVRKGLDRAAAEFNAANSPATYIYSDASPLARGSVGADGHLQIDGRFHGPIAVVINWPMVYGLVGCRVDVDMPRWGMRTITMAGDQCRIWSMPEPAQTGE